MVKVSEIIKVIEEMAPLSLASSWDNTGWQLCLDNSQVNKLLVALSPTEDVINQAIANNCEMIICHHPLIFSKINKLNLNNPLDKTVINAVKNNISIYACHTNLDAAQNGVAEVFANMLNLKNLVAIEIIDDNTGFGRKGEIEEEILLDDFIVNLKNLLNIDKIKLINPKKVKKVRKIAVCPGSGSDFIKNLKDIDLFITADIKYHTALEVYDFAVIDAGHLETERLILPFLADIIKKSGVEVLIAEEKPVWQII